MIVSEEEQFTFVHIPHTAGTSITKWIKSQVPDAKKVGDKHASASHPKNPNSHFTFCVVRNHWDWLMSTYNYILKVNCSYSQKKLEFIRQNDASISEFVVWYTQKSGLSDQNIWQGQFSWMGKGGKNVDFWLKMDHDKIKGISRLKDKIDVLSGELPHENKSSNSDRYDVFNEDAVKAVKDHYSIEIDFFGFEF